jgi:hypothetical protein
LAWLGFSCSFRREFPVQMKRATKSRPMITSYYLKNLPRYLQVSYFHP